MHSNRKYWERRIRESFATKNVAAGFVGVNGIKARIQRHGLVETERMLNSIQPDVHDQGVRIGTDIVDPNYYGQSYVELLNNGTRYIDPYHFMENGLLDKKAELRRVYGAKIRTSRGSARR